MKKLFFLLFTAVAMAACSTYDDSELRGQLDDINDRLEAMEKAVADANSDLKALQGIVDAMRDGVTITEVNETEKGYEIVFSDGKTATITNGSDGEAPAIAVKADTDGVYYWTLDGEWLLDEQGNKVKAQGLDGQAAVAPQVRINETTKEWEISTDGGEHWTSTGVVAEGSGAGSSIFQSVNTDDENYVIFTLVGGQQITIAKVKGLAFEIEGVEVGIAEGFKHGEVMKYNVKTTDMADCIISAPDGWKAAYADGVLTVTAPAEENTFAEQSGDIEIIIVSENGMSRIVRMGVRITVSYTITFEGEEWAPYVACNYKPGDFCTWTFDDKVYSWWDETTQLTTERPETSWGAGYPWIISSYNANSLDSSTYGSYNYDLYVYNPDNTDSTTGGGNNGSDNFLVSYGYKDLDPLYDYGDTRPIFLFADNVARTITSLYINTTCYFYSVAKYGNGITPALNEDVTVYATGYDAEGNELKTVSMTFASADFVTDSWTRWELSELGPVVSLRLNMGGGPDNGYGFSLPAYYAIDDITVEW